MKLTGRQQHLLAELKKLPKSFRVNGNAGGLLKPSVLDNLDGRVWSGLFQKGALSYKQLGCDMSVGIEIND